jgi:transposase InsO family protein
MRDHLRAELPLAALMMALQRQRPAAGLIQYSDRGVQYASEEYRGALQLAGMRPSMSRKGDCLDNAPMESFFHSSKPSSSTIRNMRRERMPNATCSPSSKDSTIECVSTRHLATSAPSKWNERRPNPVH